MTKLPTLQDLQQLARQAGEILYKSYEGVHQVDYKGVIDIVTEVDHQSESYLLGQIQHLFPGHQIISEEAGLLPGRDIDQWYVDPLDGTVNYAHGIPLFSVSIAYAREGDIKLGVVFDPMRDELFSAERGKGAWCNERRLQVSQVAELRHSLLVTGFPYDAWSTANNNLDNFARFTMKTQGVRRLGSAALDLCYVAAGRFDGYWEMSLQPWDMAAGSLIAEEAGAKVTTPDGQPQTLTPPCALLAAPPELHAKILEILRGEA